MPEVIESYGFHQHSPTVLSHWNWNLALLEFDLDKNEFMIVDVDHIVLDA